MHGQVGRPFCCSAQAGRLLDAGDLPLQDLKRILVDQGLLTSGGMSGLAKRPKKTE